MDKVLRSSYLLILALLPIHAFFSVWLISNIGYDTPISAWKEILLALLVPFAAVLLYKQPDVAITIVNRRINQLILVFAGLHLLLWAFTGIELDAAAAGMLINLRFLALFVLAQILVAQTLKTEDGDKQVDTLRTKAGKTVLIGGVVVSVFGALQLLVLPADWLSHFGYGPETIAPYRTIDQNEDFIRINSTLRGPNPLGLYMILAFPMLVAAFVKMPKSVVRSWQLVDWKKLRTRFPPQLPSPISCLLIVLIPASALLALYGSHSRSGWIGSAVAAALLIWLSLKQKTRRAAIWVGAASLLIGVSLAAVYWQSDFVQHTVLHQDPSGGTVVDSTAKHFQANQNALEDITAEPLGDGPGSAGPASFYNDEQTRVAENYFLQLGQEVGVLGLGLFIAINVTVVRALWYQQSAPWPRLLLASFAGLTVANFFLHAWAQDEISLIWWGLAGLYYDE